MRYYVFFSLQLCLDTIKNNFLSVIYNPIIASKCTCADKKIREHMFKLTVNIDSILKLTFIYYKIIYIGYPKMYYKGSVY